MLWAVPREFRQLPDTHELIVPMYRGRAVGRTEGVAYCLGCGALPEHLLAVGDGGSTHQVLRKHSG